MFKIITKIFSILVFTGFGLSLVSISGSALVSIAPYNSNSLDPKEKNWFLFQTKAGSEIPDAFKISNSEADAKSLKITAKDFEITQEGQYTIIPDEVENKDVGRWFKLDVSRAVVPANSEVKIPFTVKVPVGTKDGEYSAGISVTEIDTTQETVNIALRKGIRSYITVGSDFNLSAEVSSLNIVDPSDSDFASILKSKAYAGKDNTLIGVKIKNTGNIFGLLEAKYSLKYDDGSVFEGKFSTEIAPGVGSRNFYVITNQPYRAGKTEAVFDYKISPQNIEASKVKVTNSQGVLNDETKITQAQLDNFSQSKQKAFTNQTSSDNSANAEAKKSNTYENFVYIIFPTVVFFGIIVGVLIAEREVWIQGQKTKAKIKK